MIRGMSMNEPDKLKMVYNVIKLRMSDVESPIKVGIYTKVILTVGFVCFIVNAYYAINILLMPLTQETALFCLLMAIAWGIFVILISKCIKADNPQFKGE